MSWFSWLRESPEQKQERLRAVALKLSNTCIGITVTGTESVDPFDVRELAREFLAQQAALAAAKP